jgi:hypothetical protein
MHEPLIRTIVAIQIALATTAHAAGERWRAHGPSHDRESGQATTEYALVLLAAALVGLLVVGWATAGGGAGKVGRLFDRVIDAVGDKL